MLSGLAAATALTTVAQRDSLELPKKVVAGSAFSIRSSGSGDATLCIVGLGQVLKRDVHLGEAVFFPAGALYNAGRYVVVLSAGPTTIDSEQFEVVPADKPADVSFLAKPSRLPVGIHGGITGAVFVFDAWRNLITVPKPVSFQVSTSSGAVETHSVVTSLGAASIGIDSTPQQGIDRFVAQVGDVSNTRIIRQVPGDPCGLRMSARQSGQKVLLTTDPVRDCSGNAVPDGTIVTFTESYNSAQSIVDVPVKRGIAQVEMPTHDGATVSVASGVALGNQIRLER
jgi:hypothetical protein